MKQGQSARALARQLDATMKTPAGQRECARGKRQEEAALERLAARVAALLEVGKPAGRLVLSGWLPGFLDGARPEEVIGAPMGPGPVAFEVGESGQAAERNELRPKARRPRPCNHE